MNTQPEALRLADWLEHHGEKASHGDAAAELRRLHELHELYQDKVRRLEQQLGEAVWNYGEKVRANQELREALHWIANRCPVHLSDHPLHGIHREMSHDAGARARAAITKHGDAK